MFQMKPYSFGSLKSIELRFLLNQTIKLFFTSFQYHAVNKILFHCCKVKIYLVSLEKLHIQ